MPVMTFHGYADHSFGYRMGKSTGKTEASNRGHALATFSVCLAMFMPHTIIYNLPVLS